ncbi:hypothetical protein KSF_089300 [Reticulibacter mediterranei]|uniref:TIR domain-containing protein n=2 Tax=Reticulibacter mediterranei TaxID=2778369 RepID=A0A8J3N934_9CHLR|nr:hypothetical protein KSF_089300 [Reticulibacter mediterranei]
MADQQLIKRLLTGVDQWNQWRQEHPEEVRPNLIEADLRGANLHRANLREANLIEADLRGANLHRANLHRVNFDRANLRKADLRGANLSMADLREADLREADLRGTRLSMTKLISVNLSGADLSGADLSSAAIYETTLSKTRLSGTNFDDASLSSTSFGDHDFREIKGLESIRHSGPSPLSINSLYLSKGDIPEAFVRGTGAPDSFIEYMRALAAKPIEYYTCFISYSSKDQDFAKRLYADLQNEGVRCWYAPEDLKIGDPFRKRIDESIRIHDKLLLILSEHSVNSAWVEKEVETAFEKEHRNDSMVLFPVKLDETVMHTDQAWAADIRRMRHIGDLTKWKEHDAYQRGLQRLLRDLKQEKA